MNDSIDVFSVRINPGLSMNFNFTDPVVTITVYQHGKTLYAEKIPSDIDVIITKDKFMTEYFEVNRSSCQPGYITALVLFIILICLIYVINV